jgi:hypothetical protein
MLTRPLRNPNGAAYGWLTSIIVSAYVVRAAACGDPLLRRHAQVVCHGLRPRQHALGGSRAIPSDPTSLVSRAGIRKDRRPYLTGPARWARGCRWWSDRRGPMAETELQGHAAKRRALESARQNRAAILELAVRAEYVLGEALAYYLAADEGPAAILQEHMMWRVPIEVKLKLLSQAMDAYGISDSFPFVIPVLTRLFQIRNILAHSLETPVPEERHEIGFVSVHRGRVTEHSIPVDSLDWLWHQGNQVFGELLLISSALGDLRFYEDQEKSQGQ